VPRLEVDLAVDPRLALPQGGRPLLFTGVAGLSLRAMVWRAKKRRRVPWPNGAEKWQALLIEGQHSSGKPQ
jgi:hypothetical protein